LGVGITHSASIEPLLEQYPSLFDVVEIEPQTTWLPTPSGPAPFRLLDSVLEHLAGLPGRKIVHSVGTPVGGTVRPDPTQLALLSKTIKALHAPWASDHLSFNATPQFSTGFFLPPRQTPEGVETVSRSIRDLQQALIVPIAVETGVNYLRPRSDEMPDGLFVAAVAEATDCGLLLDLHNVFANSLNGRQPMNEFLTQIPLDRVWEVHLAGGFEMDGYWLDAHSGPIPAPLLDVAQRVIPALPNLKGIIFEIFPSFVAKVGLDVIRAQIEKLHELWDLRRSGPGMAPRYVSNKPLPIANSADVLSAAEWEQAVGALAIGRTPAGAAGELADDPGVAVVRNLIREFRASMIVGVLRLTARLLMLALGADVFRAILAGFWSEASPQQFAAAEAVAFADYLIRLRLGVPQLTSVLNFERAVLATLTDERPRIIEFDFDPLPLLRALAEGRLPEVPGQQGRFEIKVTADDQSGIVAVDRESLQSLVPFH
jgi:uncharacterized protein (UPF0276 family)